MRPRLVALTLLVSAATPAAASAAGWSAVPTPARSGPAGLACVSTRWCEAVGGWNERLTAARWNGWHWRTEPAPATARNTIGTLVAITCRSTRWCVAVGEDSRPGRAPAHPLIERWNGSRWSIQAAPSAPPPPGYRATNNRLAGVACPSSSLCFAVGQAVPFGAGNAPGVALIEWWNGQRWSRVRGPRAAAPLMSISCTSARACVAVGGYSRAVGTPASGDMQVVERSVIERWNGRGWSEQAAPMPAGAAGALLSGVSCTSAIACTAVGSAGVPPSFGAVPVAEAMVDTLTGSTWSTQTLSAPAGVERPPATEPWSTALTAVACPTSATCASVGTYGATNGDIGPLAAAWNGATWTQTVLRRGPVQLASVACPALGWCMAVGGGIAERFIG